MFFYTYGTKWENKLMSLYNFETKVNSNIPEYCKIKLLSETEEDSIIFIFIYIRITLYSFLL